MAGHSAFIAVEWGTTNRRAMLIGANGEVLDAMADAAGVLTLNANAYPGEVAALRRRFGGLPVLAAGMVGSDRGWVDAFYLDAPCRIEDLADALVEAAPDVRIVPGVALRGGRMDVMRGEEVQAFGAVAAGLSACDALICQPGTHNKWITVVDGALVESATAMTGELFTLLRSHGTLAGMLDGDAVDGAAFREGLARGMVAVDLQVALFEVRAAVLLGRLHSADAASFASGLLIGSDVGGRTGLAGGEVVLVGTGPLAELYAAAIGAAGGRAALLDGRSAFVAGMRRIWEIAA